MKFFANGWTRDHGAISLFNADFNRVTNKNRIDVDEISMQQTESGIHIFWGKEYVVLNGKYMFQLELSKKDVAKIFVETFSNVSFENIISILNEAKSNEANPKMKADD